MALGKATRRLEEKRSLSVRRAKQARKLDGTDRKFSKHLDLAGGKPMQGNIHLNPFVTPVADHDAAKVFQVNHALNNAFAAQGMAAGAQSAADGAQSTASRALQEVNGLTRTVGDILKDCC